MNKDPRVTLVQILERGDRIAQIASSGRAEFFKDFRNQDTIIRNFEVISEATRRIPQTSVIRTRRFPG